MIWYSIVVSRQVSFVPLCLLHRTYPGGRTEELRKLPYPTCVRCDVGLARDLILDQIDPGEAAPLIVRHHYSRAPLIGQKLCLGVFLGGALQGCLTFGSGLAPRRARLLVPGTDPDGFLEVGRVAFSPV